MNDCNYPKCSECTRPECNMEDKDINALLKRRRRNADPMKYREKQNSYRKTLYAALPHCDECEDCILVKSDKLGSKETYRRLCTRSMKLIEQKVVNCPKWCERRSTI